MIIRNITIADYDGISRLWTGSEGTGLRSLDDSRQGIERFLKRNPATSFLCLKEDRVTGVLLCGHDGRRGFIYHTVVDRAFRGQGIGRALVDHCLSALKAERIHKVALVAFKTNTEGNGFWEALGFTERPDLTYRNRSLNPDNI